MITAYLLSNQVLSVINLTVENTIPENTIWLDIYKPDDDERLWIKNLFISEVPEEEELDDIEASSRFYQDKEGVHILSLFPQRIGNETKGVNVSFTIRNGLLLSLREEDIGVVRLLRQYMRQNQIQINNAVDILLELQSLKIEYLSDLIEDSFDSLDYASEQVLQGTGSAGIQDMMKELMFQHQACTHIHLALGDTRRALRYIRKVFASSLQGGEREEIDEVLHDIESLLPHTQFLFDKIDFLLESAMGFTNLQQNSIIKIFSVAAVVFMPPTWIASIYGMNFSHMPELEWIFGYPFSIGLMIVSAFATYLFFRKKGWL
ncbi:MAG: magnesium/cobalt transporter CorA [Succinivibrionaceae bacterium]|jgi:magnesium transporter|nr:magnesium/cobalt transporter CorA [Succinivibrionaceae bacterium]